MSNQKKEKVVLPSAVQTVLEEITTKSCKIRLLSKLGYERGDISRILDIRYQHVRNVLISGIKEDDSIEYYNKVKEYKVK